MKWPFFMQQIFQVLFVACLIVGCSPKKDVPQPVTPPTPVDTIPRVDTVPKKDSILLLTRIDHYGLYSDTNFPALMVDTIYYNATHTIDSIYSRSPNIASAMTYHFTYDSRGNITECRRISKYNPEKELVYYKLHYDSEGRLDSMYRYDYIKELAYILSYDDQDHVKHIRTYWLRGYDYPTGKPISGTDFYRNSTRQIDSIVTDNEQPDLSVSADMRGAAVIPATAVNRSYMFTLGATWDFIFLGVPGVNLFMLQYLNPDDDLLKSGTYNGNLFVDFTVSVYPDGNVRSMTLKQKTVSPNFYLYGKKIMRYTKVPK